VERSLVHVARARCCVQESSFATLFPKYREKYLREVWPLVDRSLKHYGIECKLNSIEGSMTVRTTLKTWDPYIIVKARDLIKLLARSIPVQRALNILNDGVFCDIIKIKNVVRHKERFVKRRNRLIGPNGSTLKAMELVTDCYIMVQGNTVAAVGSVKGLKAVRKIVVDCMKNIHPVYNIKQLMIKKELAEDPALANENWDRFLPKFKKKNVPRRKPFQTKPDKPENKEFNPFPPPQLPRKIDLQLESGEYFLSDAYKQNGRKEQKRREKVEERRKRKASHLQEFAPPEAKKKTRKGEVDGKTAEAADNDATSEGTHSAVSELSEESSSAETLKKIKAKSSLRRSAAKLSRSEEDESIGDYLMGMK